MSDETDMNLAVTERRVTSGFERLSTKTFVSTKLTAVSAVSAVNDVPHNVSMSSSQ